MSLHGTCLGGVQYQAEMIEADDPTQGFANAGEQGFEVRASGDRSRKRQNRLVDLACRCSHRANHNRFRRVHMASHRARQRPESGDCYSKGLGAFRGPVSASAEANAETQCRKAMPRRDSLSLSWALAATQRMLNLVNNIRAIEPGGAQFHPLCRESG